MYFWVHCGTVALPRSVTEVTGPKILARYRHLLTAAQSGHADQSTAGCFHLQLQQLHAEPVVSERWGGNAAEHMSGAQSVYVGCVCVRVFLALVTAHGFRSIHISKWNPGCRRRRLVAAEVLVSASPPRSSQRFYKLLPIPRY